MPIKPDEQILNEYLPKIKAFVGERLTAENAKRIYNFLKPYHYDTGGWLLYEAAKDLLRTDVYSEFPAEDNMGYFETLDGFGLLKWLEIAKFAEKEYEQIRGGYELLKSHTLDKIAPNYRKYQNALWLAVMRNIVENLAEKQPYLLEGFWNRLSYIENILEKGFPTRDDLNEKIESEAKMVFDAASEDDLTSFHSEVEIKYQIKGALCSTSMTDEMVQAVFIKDNALDDVYRFIVEENRDDQIHLGVWEYLDKAERDYIADRVFDRVKLEYEDYVDEVKTWPPQKIVDEAYKLTMLYDIYSSLDPYCSEYSTERLKALYSISDPLWSVYHEWQHRDYSHMDDIKDVIEYIADKQAEKNEDRSFQDEDELEDEDEQEL